MSRHNSSSSHSNPSEHSFPFQNDEDDDTLTHPTLLPNGILNDDEDEDDVVPAWPRKSSGRSASQDTQQQLSPAAVLNCRQLPTDLSAREFAGLFTFADGYIESSLKEEQGERMGTASFNSSNNAAKARSKMASIVAYSQVIFDITPTKSLTSSNGVDVPTPPATLSTSSKSTGSSGSMQHSRLSSYVKDKPDLTPINAVPTLTPSNPLGMDEFYGSVPKGSLGVISSSVPTNFSTSAGGTVWSPTSPRFASVGSDLAKSPPAGFSMLPPPTAKADDAWSRSTTATRFSGLSLNGAPPDLARGTADRNGAQGGMSPILSHGFPSIDKSLGSPLLNGNAPPFAGTYQHAGMGFNPASAKQHAGMMNNAYAAMNPTATGFVIGNRLGPALINTNPADQNPPCNTLYVGNLPLATTEEELKSLFSRQQGYRRLCYRTKSNGPMCFVEFEDVHYAIQALKLLQGVILSSSIKGGIRLSFSKNPLGVRKMDVGQGFAPQQQSQQQQHHHHHHSHTLQQHQQHGQASMGQHAHMGAPGHVNNGYAPLAPPGLASSNGHTTSHASQQPPIGVFGHGMPPAQHQAQSSQAPVWR